MSYDASIQRVARDALKYVKEDYIIGLGSGRAATALVVELAQIAASMRVSGVPTSLQIRLVAENSGMRMLDPSAVSRLDVVFDGADQIDSAGYMIKGGGGALLRENILAGMAETSVIMADETKFVDILCRTVPIEVHPAARGLVAGHIDGMRGQSHLRIIHHGYPAFTESGNIILDCDFGAIHDPSALASDLRQIPGVLEVGIFERPDVIYRAGTDDYTVIQPLR